MKKGLIMEGGAMRGMFTCGVIDVFMEQNIEFDGAAGISAGAVFGCNYVSRQIGRPIRYNKRFCKDPRYCSIRSLLKTGDLFGAKFCYDDLPNELDPFDNETYDSNPMAFYAVCTDVETGKAIYPERYPVDAGLFFHALCLTAGIHRRNDSSRRRNSRSHPAAVLSGKRV